MKNCEYCDAGEGEIHQPYCTLLIGLPIEDQQMTFHAASTPGVSGNTRGTEASVIGGILDDGLGILTNLENISGRLWCVVDKLAGPQVQAEPDKTARDGLPQGALQTLIVQQDLMNANVRSISTALNELERLV
jgi:hypothetical protein